MYNYPFMDWEFLGKYHKSAWNFVKTFLDSLKSLKWRASSIIARV
ncbi:hypothetical protein HMPREF9413_1604 [Paenibacillus sp. HGF7]|nr:hypothetical protein HMPREF9413_1604 [Paenibacillus sp. HGF7]EPD90352.1 hypothetical protein HMPREF1207_01138 [Paenibacillus sp. HGH0039]